MAVPRTILLAVDFSECSRAALEAAVGLAKDLNADIVLVHAFPPGPMLPPGHDENRVDSITLVKLELNKGDAVELSTGWAADIRRHGINVETVAREERPEQLILDEAKRHNVALIILGTHGRAGFRRLALGSVAEAVVRRSDRPVLTVPDSKAG